MIPEMGTKPRGFSQSPRPVWAAMSNAAGSPQKSVDKPRTRPRSEDSSAALRSSSGMPSLEGEVSVVPETAFILVQPSHTFAWFHPVTFDRDVDLRFQLPCQILFVVLHGGQRLHNRGALDDFLDVITCCFIRIEEDMHLIYAAKEVVQVAHDVLIGAHQEKTKIVGLLPIAILPQFMQRQSVAHVAQIDEFVDLPVGIARDVHQRSLTGWAFIQPADRHNRE